MVTQPDQSPVEEVPSDVEEIPAVAEEVTEPSKPKTKAKRKASTKATSASKAKVRKQRKPPVEPVVDETPHTVEGIRDAAVEIKERALGGVLQPFIESAGELADTILGATGRFFDDLGKKKR